MSGAWRYHSSVKASSLGVLILFLFTGRLNAQTDVLKKQRIDSLSSKLRTDSLRTFRFKKLRPYANIDNRISFVKNPATISGLQLGIIVNEYHTFGFGSYRLNRSQNDSPIRDGYRLNRLSYFTSFYEYFLVNHRYLEIDLPFEIGFGKYNARIVDTLDTKRDQNISKAFIPLGSAVKLILKPVRWIGLSLMGGYRYVLEKKTNLNLNGVYYSLGVWVDIRQIYRDIKFYGFQKKKYRREVHQILIN
jgi:hypothetical protein